MVELAQREKIIIHMLNIMNNPQLQNAPLEIRTKALQSVLLVAGYEWNENEMTDLMNSVTAETNSGMQSALKMLDKFGFAMKGLRKI